MHVTARGSEGEKAGSRGEERHMHNGKGRRKGQAGTRADKK